MESFAANMKITHLTTSLEIGGAQMMLYRLLDCVQKPNLEYSVVSLMDKGNLGALIERSGVPVFEVGMRQGSISPSALWRLVQLLRQLQPEVIQAWTYHANIAATISTWIMPGRVPVIWSIHHTLDNLRSEKPLTRILIWLGILLSGFPARIHYCSHVSATQHEAIGYVSGLREVIPNGFDCVAFQPSPLACNKLRQSLGVSDDTVLIGTIARYHPMKDHANFISAANRLVKDRPGVHFVMVGRNVDSSNWTLVRQIQDAGLESYVHLLGEHHDIRGIVGGLDILSTSSAWGESFPLVVGEAMACAVPCVVTDVGDSAKLVGHTGIVVPPRDSPALAAAWEKLLMLAPEERHKLGVAARRRVEEHYSLETMVRAYEDLYVEVRKGRSIGR